MKEIQKQQKQKTITSKTHNITINQQTLQQTPNAPTLPVIEESPGASQFSPHSITPSKISSTQSISSSSSSSTPKHSQTPQQQTPTRSQNSQSTQAQSGTQPPKEDTRKKFGSVFANSEAVSIEGSNISITSQVLRATSLSRSSNPSIGSSNN